MSESSCGFSNDPLSTIATLQSVLKRYETTDILRELIQNADDAKASKLVVTFIEEGIANAIHPLLQTPALLIFNNGAFKEHDCEGIQRSISGSKEKEESKVGRFGLGLKSIFNICEAFFFCGTDKSKKLGKLFNPWKPFVDKPQNNFDGYKEWHSNNDEYCIEALNYLFKQCSKVYPELKSNGFFIYAPIRTENAYKGKVTLKEDFDVDYTTIYQNIHLPLLLSQCAYLNDIAITSAKNINTLEQRNIIEHFITDRVGSLSRPTSNNADFTCKTFSSVISSQINNLQSHVCGIEVLDKNHKDLKAIYDSNDWPTTPVFKEKKKSLAHAAITILKEKDSFEGQDIIRKLTVRWASFLPFDEKTSPSLRTTQSIPQEKLHANYTIILHGYFWPSDDRKSLEGIDNGKNGAEGRWNKELAEKLLFPLIPEAFSKAFTCDTYSYEELSAILECFQRTTCKKEYEKAICSKNSFIQKLVYDKSKFSFVWGSYNNLFYTIPKEQIPSCIEKWFIKNIHNNFTNEEFGLFSKNCVQKWSDDLFEDFFGVIPSVISSQDAIPLSKWLKDFLAKCIQVAEEQSSLSKKLSQKQEKSLGTWFINYIAAQKGNIHTELLEVLNPYLNIYKFPKNTTNAIVFLAEKRHMSPKFILIPHSTKEVKSPSLGKELEDILIILGNTIKEKMSTGSNIDDFINLSDVLRPIYIPESLKSLPLIRVKEFRGDGSSKEIACSFHDLKEKEEAKQVFKSTHEDRLVDEEIRSLSYAINSSIWRLGEQTKDIENIDISKGFTSFCTTILSSNLNADICKRIPLAEHLLKVCSLEDGITKRAVRTLFAGHHIADNIRLVMCSANQKVSEQQKAMFIPISKENCENLTRKQFDALGFIEFDNIKEEYVRDLLNATKPWERYRDIIDAYGDPFSIPNGLHDNFAKSPWLPSLDGLCGYAPRNIFTSSEKYLGNVFKEMLPTTWASLDMIIDDRKVRQYVDLFYNQEKNQIKELLHCINPTASQSYFPRGLNNNQYKDWLIEIYKDSSPCFIKEIVQKFTDLIPDFIHTFSHEKPEQYHCILKRAQEYYSKNKSKASKNYINLVYWLYKIDKDIFLSDDILYPTDKGGVWKRGCEIAISSNERSDLRVQKDMWVRIADAWHDYSNAKEINTNANVEQDKYILEKFFENYSKIDKFSERIQFFIKFILNKNRIRERTIEKSTVSPNISTILKVQSCEEVFTLSGGTRPIQKSDNKEQTPFIEIHKGTENQKNVLRVLLSVRKDNKCFAAHDNDFADKLKEAFKKLDRVFDSGNDISNKWEQYSPTQISIDGTIRLIQDGLQQTFASLSLPKDSKVYERYEALRAEIIKDEPSKKEKLLDALWNEAKHDDSVLQALRKKIEDSGYRNENVLFELFQNADDAVVEACEAGLKKSHKVCIKLHGRTLEFIHSGRPINEQGIARNARWGYDLYNMLMMNISGKHDEYGIKTTGMFGLGFKSVHLICNEPEIHSKDLHFCIKNGLLPETLKDMPTSAETKFILPLRAAIRGDVLLDHFKKVAPLLPVFAKKIREISINEDGKTEILTFSPSPVMGTAWKIDKERDIQYFEHGDFSLAILGKQENSSCFTLWCTLPTRTGQDWGLRYAINGPFRLDPGRANADICDKTTLKDVQAFGEALGKSLCQYEANDEEKATLWNILASGLDLVPDAESDRSKFLRKIHGEGRGLSAWARQSIIASGLPSEFSPLLSVEKSATLHVCRNLDKALTLPKDERMALSFISEKNAQVLKFLSVDISFQDWPSLKQEIPSLYTASLESIELQNTLNIENVSQSIDDIFDNWTHYKKQIQYAYLEDTWPEYCKNGKIFTKFLEQKDRKAWYILLLLSLFQSMGRTKSNTHRNFISILDGRDWLFSEKKIPDAQWLTMLRDWQDEKINKLNYAEHMKFFPLFHQNSRFLDQYINVLSNAPQILKRHGFNALFAPRSCSDLRGTGSRFNAPPLPVGMGRYWLLRELVRLNFKNFQSEEVLFPYCWVPYHRTLEALKLNYINDREKNRQAIVGRLQKLGVNETHHDFWFDIALWGE